MCEIEYANYDLGCNDSELKADLAEIKHLKPDIISVLPYYLKGIKNLIPDSTKLSTVIDYPFGLSTTDSRVAEIEQAVKNGADIIEVVAPLPVCGNRKYDKFRQDINACRNICNQHAVECRYILEYRIMSADLMYKCAQILAGFKIETVYVSTSHLLDCIADHMLACILTNQKVAEINIMAGGPAWTDKQLEILFNNKDKIKGYKCTNPYSLEKIVNFLHTSSSK